MDENTLTGAAPAGTETPADPASEVFSALAKRYNTAPDAYGDMLEFLKLDETRLPKAVTALGLKPASVRMLELLRTENSLRSRREKAAAQAKRWQEEAAGMSADLRTLTKDERFTRLLRAGFSVSDACRMTEDRSGAEARKLLDRIASRALRPAEQAARSIRAGIPPAGAATLTRTERERIEQRALRGEKVRI